jgi:hypothetical protein
MNVGFCPSEEDLRIIEANRRNDETTSHPPRTATAREA